MHIHDLIGIGFGPSNMALAIALDEQASSHDLIDAHFIERQPHFSWHPDMLLAQSHMQICFLKDLVTPRNPRSHFTFINYLHEKQRFHDFINLKTFTPSRHEFNDYLSWVAAHFADACTYGQTVIGIQPCVENGVVSHLEILSRDTEGQLHRRLARNIVLSVGGTGHVPAVFQPLRNDPRIIHANRYLSGMAANSRAERIAIIGAGQSAAEIFMDLINMPHAPRVDMIMRAGTLKPADDSAFVNEIFNPEFVDYVHARNPQDRQEFLREYRHTNYACPDADLIQQLYAVLYEQKVRNDARHRMLKCHQISRVHADPAGVTLDMYDDIAGRETSMQYDAVILATGYERGHHRDLLKNLDSWIDNHDADRQYRLETGKDFQPSIFVQGASEHTHGLSDTLMSVMAIRSGEIATSIRNALSEKRSQKAPSSQEPLSA